MNYILTNFAYGTGPFLRTTHEAIYFNNAREKQGRERWGILVPLVYGEKQRSLMREVFAEHEKKHPGEILLSEALGAVLKKVFYENESFEAYLTRWIEAIHTARKEAHALIAGTFEAETLRGEKKIISGRDIAVELARSPRMSWGVERAYAVSFARMADIYREAGTLPFAEIAIDRRVLREAATVAEGVEKNYKWFAIGFPGTLEALTHTNDFFVPPLGEISAATSSGKPEGIYVSVSGIGGSEQLYENVRKIGGKMWSNRPDVIHGATKADPAIMGTQPMFFQIARAGWGAIWLSLSTQTPLLLLPHDPSDDPEIALNIRAVEREGIGIVYRGESFDELLRKRAAVQARQRKLCGEIKKRWGTFDGLAVAAELFSTPKN